MTMVDRSVVREVVIVMKGSMRSDRLWDDGVESRRKEMMRQLMCHLRGVFGGMGGGEKCLGGVLRIRLFPICGVRRDGRAYEDDRWGSMGMKEMNKVLR